MPVTAVATTGVPQAMASRTTVGRPSTLPSAAGTHGATRTWEPFSRACTSLWVSAPGSWTRSPSPSSRTSAASESPSSPSPAITAVTSTPESTRAASARSRTSKPFLGTRRPTAATLRAVPGAGGAGGRKGKRSSSRAL